MAPTRASAGRAAKAKALRQTSCQKADARRRMTQPTPIEGKCRQQYRASGKASLTTVSMDNCACAAKMRRTPRTREHGTGRHCGHVRHLQQLELALAACALVAVRVVAQDFREFALYEGPPNADVRADARPTSVEAEAVHRAPWTRGDHDLEPLQEAGLQARQRKQFIANRRCLIRPSRPALGRQLTRDLTKNAAKRETRVTTLWATETTAPVNRQASC